MFENGEELLVRCRSRAVRTATTGGCPHLLPSWSIGVVVVTVVFLLVGIHDVRAQSQFNSVLNPDFNGDGFDDLAIGVPGEEISTVQEAGAIQVLYGSVQGLTISGNQFWHRGVEGIPGDLNPGEKLGSVIATGDFNGDGYTDLVAASPFTSLSGRSNVGSVLVLYGSMVGLSAQGSQSFQPDAAIRLFFGASLAAGDFDADGYDDLAIGTPGDLGARGSVAILPGSEEGLLWEPGIASKLTKSQITNPPGEGKQGDLFGKALAAGDFNKDGFADLAIGAPQDVLTGTGILYAVFGTSDGLKPSASQSFTQDSSLVLDQSEIGDQFAQSLIAGDFDGNGASDLAIGIPGEDLAGNSNAGAVAVLQGFTGLTTQNNQLWHQDIPGVSGAVETDDSFGARLATGDFNGDTFFDLAIGVPREDFANQEDAGVIHVLYGSPQSLSANNEQLWHHDSPNIARAVEESETFGAALGTGDFNGDGFHDLAIGVPGERFAGTSDAGGVTVLYGSLNGLQASNNQFWYQDGDGMPGGVENGDRFGGSLSGGDADSPF